MNTALVAIDSTAVAPAYADAFFGEEDNVAAKVTIPSLSFKGKVWRVAVDGSETVLTRKNQDGEDEPTPIVKMVVLNFSKARSRAYYEGAYEEGKAAAPRCASIDGVAPDASVAEPMSSTCASCPMSAKGSKISDNGKATVACAQNKRLVVVPAAKLDFQPLLLRLAPTSIWDKDNKENEAKGWFAWDQYVDWLRTKGVNHTAKVVTSIKFDSRVAYPKLLFKGAGWLDEASMSAAAKVWNSEAVTDILSGKEFATAKPSGSEGAAPEGDDDMAAPAPTPAPAPKVKAAPKPKPAPVAPAPVAAVDDDDDEDGGIFQPAAAAAPAPAPAPAPAAAAPVAAAAAPAAATVAAGLAGLMAEWDD
jgi:hypothetical protein